MLDRTTTIVATATATGGAISVIRLSGSDSLSIVAKLFNGKLQDRVAVFGTIKDGTRTVDEVVATYFKAPRSYTGEDSVEISCHGSTYVTGEIIRLLINAGAVMASAGEFTMRAFMNGKLDLSQAEAVADLIAANSHSSAQVALQQMRGGYSEELRTLSSELLDILSLLELELDFGEEDVEFADRSHMQNLILLIRNRVAELADSFKLGNVLKNGVPVAIVGKPNVGKSTLLNKLLGEERAIVSPIAGTTRDFIEETLVIDGITFRFIDTAGLRTAEDEIEQIGIERSYEKLRNATIILNMVESLNDAETLTLTPDQTEFILVNKSDLNSNKIEEAGASKSDVSHHLETNRAVVLSISAKYGDGIEQLKARLAAAVCGLDYDINALIVSNSRHYEALTHSRDAFDRAMNCLNEGLPTDLISAEIRASLTYLREITGEITTDDILGNIFSKFCIGK